MLHSRQALLMDRSRGALREALRHAGTPAALPYIIFHILVRSALEIPDLLLSYSKTTNNNIIAHNHHTDYNPNPSFYIKSTHFQPLNEVKTAEGNEEMYIENAGQACYACKTRYVFVCWLVFWCVGVK